MAVTTKSRTKSDEIFDEIVTRIATGAYPPDFNLPGEHELSVSFGVSRPVLRDALRRLREEGYIYSRHGIGSFVRRTINSATQLGYMPVDSIADIQRCYEFRLTVEPKAAEAAALRRDAESLQALSGHLENLREATDQHVHREDTDYEFHLAVAVASNNHYFTSTIKALHGHITVGMRLHGKALLGPPEGLEAVYLEHKGILDAISEQDPNAARDRMAAHLEGSRDRLFEGRLLDLSH